MAVDADNPEPKRRRGTRIVIGDDGRHNADRDTGSPAAADAEGTDASRDWETVSETVTPNRRKRSSKASTANARAMADLLIGGVETLAYARYQTVDARMAPHERKMALDGLAESVKVLPSETVAQISALSAPVMACFGFALYAMRLGELERRKRHKSAEERAIHQAESLLNEPRSQEVYGPTMAENGYVVPPKSYLQNLQET